MGIRHILRQSVVAAIVLCGGFSVAAAADERLGGLMEELRAAEPEAAARLNREIELAWSQSGSVAINMLLQRGRTALEAEDFRTAAQHFTALTDHAPFFAEGWHSRARAYFALDLYGPAIEDLGQALRLNPDHYQAVFGLGVILTEIGETARAADAFRRALELHPNFTEAQDALKRLERDGIGRTL